MRIMRTLLHKLTAWRPFTGVSIRRLAVVFSAVLATMFLTAGTAYGIGSSSPRTPTVSLAQTETPSPTPPPSNDATPAPNNDKTAPADDAPASPPLTPKQRTKAGASTVGLILTWSQRVTMMPPTGRPSVQTVNVSGECTGFYVGQSTGPDSGFIATAGHCLDPDEVKFYLAMKVDSLTNPSPSYGTKGGPTDDSMTQNTSAVKVSTSDPELRIQVNRLDDTTDAQTKPIDAHMVAFTPFAQGDYGLVKVDSLTAAPTPALPIATTELALGDNLLSVGLVGSMLQDSITADQPTTGDMFSNNSPYADNPGQFAKDVSGSRASLSFKDGNYSGKQQVSGTEFEQTDAALSSGMSGGPTLKSEKGRAVVVGTNSYTRDMQAFNFFTRPAGLRMFLVSHGVTNELASVSTPDTSPGSTTPAVSQGSTSTDIALQSNSQSDISSWINTILLCILTSCVVAGLIMYFMNQRQHNRPIMAQNLDDTTNDAITNDTTTQPETNHPTDQPSAEEHTTPIGAANRPADNQ